MFIAQKCFIPSEGLSFRMARNKKISVLTALMVKQQIVVMCMFLTQLHGSV